MRLWQLVYFHSNGIAVETEGAVEVTKTTYMGAEEYKDSKCE
jgi:hypothetical protein